MRWAMDAQAAGLRSGIEKGSFLSRVMTSIPFAVETAREEWKRLIAYASVGM